MDALPLWLPTVLACIAALLVAGTVKGVVSLGLPLVGLPLLMLAIDVKTAVGLLMVPLVVSNFLQALQGKGTLALLRRFWPLLLCMTVGTIIGTALFAALDRHILLLTIGSCSILFATATFLHPNLAIGPRGERWLGPPVGFVAGVIGGMSTLFGPILANYVVALQLPRDTFVKAISILYVVASVVLLLGSTAQGTSGATLLVLSGLAMIPVYAGMLIGQRMRSHIDPDRFRLLVIAVVWLTGANLIRMGLGL